MPTIQQLPPSVVNKIAAGEVIERPASVVKELLENAVDAGSTRIDVTVAKGGSELIRVTDNGHGIPQDQVHLAVASHATSKIRDADDLFQVSTLGFRGEALASIAAVSQLVLRSRTADADGGTQLEVNGGNMSGPMPCGCAPGTTVEASNLFFNTPVRRKFLRATQTEMGHVTEAFIRIALGHSQIHFTLRHNDKLIHELPAVENWRDRIVSVFGSELGEGLMSVESSDEDIRLSGFAADPNFSRGNNRMQYLFLNGRHIRDRSLQHALGEAYRGLLLTGRYPIAFMRLDMPSDEVDVNVHPAKLEVRFQDGGRIYSQLLGTLRKRFLTTDLTAKVQSAAGTVEDHPAAAVDPQRSEQHRRELADWAKGQLSTDSVPVAEIEPTQTDLNLPYDRRPDHASLSPRPLPVDSTSFKSSQDLNHDRPPPVTADSATSPMDAPSRLTALQVQNRYLITEDESGVVVIDQHALHERILYEQLREKILDGEMETQRLLVPEPVSLTAAEAATALDSKELLSQLGIEIEPFGGDTVLISAYPAMLANLSPAEVLHQVVEQLMADGKNPDRRDLLDDLLHMISCKAAIKAGDRLSPVEINALLEHRGLCQDSHHCPHGRPTLLVFTREELDRRFKRT